MIKSKDIRDVVIVHYQNSQNAPEISTMLVNDVHCVIVHRWIQRFDPSSSVNGSKSFGRRRAGGTKRLINLVKRPVMSQNARKSLRTMAKDFVLVLFFGKWIIKSSNIFF